MYDDFINWLEYEARLLKNPDQAISYGTKNHCIKSLNTFMRYLYNDRMISKLVLCPKFPPHMLGERTIDDVISLSEMEAVYECLNKQGFVEEGVFF